MLPVFIYILTQIKNHIINKPFSALYISQKVASGRNYRLCPTVQNTLSVLKYEITDFFFALPDTVIHL